MKKNLKRRKILNEGTCDHCGQAEESVLHAIWECSKLTAIWDAIPDFSFRQALSFVDIKELLLYVSNQGRTQDFKTGGPEISEKKKFQICIHIVLINYNPKNQGQFFEIVFERLEHPHFPEMEHPHFLELE